MRIELTDPRAIGAVITQILEGENRAALARELGTSRETLYRWEQGKSTPGLVLLEKLAKTTDNEIIIHLNPKPGAIPDSLILEALQILAEDNPSLKQLLESMPSARAEE